LTITVVPNFKPNPCTRCGERVSKSQGRARTAVHRNSKETLHKLFPASRQRAILSLASEIFSPELTISNIGIAPKSCTRRIVWESPGCNVVTQPNAWHASSSNLHQALTRLLSVILDDSSSQRPPSHILLHLLPPLKRLRHSRFPRHSPHRRWINTHTPRRFLDQSSALPTLLPVLRNHALSDSMFWPVHQSRGLD